MPDLVITLPSGRSFRHTLAAETLVIGREMGCGVFIDDPSTSRQHARVTPTTEGYLIEDLGSKNGTLINGEPSKSHVLRDGDIITLGQVVLDYQDAATASAKTVVIDDQHETPNRATTFVSRDKELLLSQMRLKKIYDLSDRLTRLRTDRNALLDDALTICFETLGFERGAVGVRKATLRGVDWPIVRNLHGAEGELTISRTLLSRALDHGERAIFTDEGGQHHDPTVSIVQHGIRSAMCVPLMHEDDILGVIYGDRTTSSTKYTQEDIDFFAAIARQVSIGLINFQLAEEQKKLAQINYDLDMARRIQRGLFPNDLPARADLRIAALNEPGRRISGDYYDVIELPDGRVWLLIADVTGEGMPAALLMANLQAAVRVTYDETDDPGALLSRWNTLICANTDGSKFITCLLALIDPSIGQLRVATAGHPQPLIFSGADTKPTELDLEPGCPLGVLEGETFASLSVTLGPRPFSLVAFTDGVIEAMDKDRGLFGEERLIETVAANRTSGPAALVKQIRKAVTHFVDGAPQSDDITLLAAHVGA